MHLLFWQLALATTNKNGLCVYTNTQLDTHAHTWRARAGAWLGEGALTGA
jgi:hypothetical protein